VDGGNISPCVDAVFTMVVLCHKIIEVHTMLECQRGHNSNIEVGTFILPLFNEHMISYI
jgi:hypothetical protein